MQAALDTRVLEDNLNACIKKVLLETYWPHNFGDKQDYKALFKRFRSSLRAHFRGLKDKGEHVGRDAVMEGTRAKARDYFAKNPKCTIASNPSSSS